MAERYVTIKKGNVEMIVDRVGAQLVSYKIDGVEIMYQGALEPETHAWTATAKNLFPNPGPVAQKGTEPETIVVNKNGKEVKQTVYTHNSGIYAMEQHGFVQSKIFDVQGHDKSSCLMTTRADDETILEYPYQFSYHVGYEIGPHGELIYDTHATNLDNKPMLAGMGWHPGFQLHNKKARYYVIFKNVKAKPGCTIPEGTKIYVDDVLNNGKAISIEGIESADVELVMEGHGGKGITYVTMHTEEPVFLLWAKEEGMICLEPWNTTPRQIGKLTTQDKTPGLAETGAKIIEPGKTDDLKCVVSVNPRYLTAIKEHHEEDEIWQR